MTHCYVSIGSKTWNKVGVFHSVSPLFLQNSVTLEVECSLQKRYAYSLIAVVMVQCGCAGMAAISDKQMAEAEKQFIMFEAMINSMTKVQPCTLHVSKALSLELCLLIPVSQSTKN